MPKWQFIFLFPVFLSSLTIALSLSLSVVKHGQSLSSSLDTFPSCTRSEMVGSQNPRPQGNNFPTVAVNEDNLA